MTGRTLQAALKYAAMGWPVFPCWWAETRGPGHSCACGLSDSAPNHSPGKHPLGQCAPNGLRSATTDKATIRQWWTEYPDANIGLATGNGIIVIDIDPRHGGTESWRDLEIAHTGCPTVTCLTGGGGQHLYFRHDGRIPNSTERVATGIDVRGDGGYVILPPSNHVSGGTYEWEASAHPDDMPMTTLPLWLAGLCLQQRPNPDQIIVVPDKIPKGGRHKFLCSIAGTNRSRGLGERELLALLLAVNKERLEEPYADTDIEKIARDYAKYPISKFGMAKVVDEQPPEYIGPPDDEKPRITLSPIRLSDLELQDIPEPQWMIPGVLPAGLALLSGRPKVGKSWLALQWSLAIASGGLAFEGKSAQKADVLYLGLEDTKRRMQDRSKLLMLGCPCPSNLWVICCNENVPRFPDLGDWLREWLAMPDHVNVRLVVIDTFQKVKQRAGNGMNAYEADYEAGGALKRLADDCNLCVLTVHHVSKGKSPEDIHATVSGSFGLTGAVDTSLVLHRARAENTATLHITGRDVEDGGLALSRDQGCMIWKLLGSAEEVARSAERQEILEYVRSCDRPVNPARIAKDIGRTPGAIRQLVRHMVDDGELFEGAAYGTYYWK